MYSPESFVKHKDLPNFSSIFGNLGQSWDNPLPNDLYIKKVPKNILSNSASVGNVGTGLDPLRSFTFPAKSLKNNNDFFHARFAMLFAANADTKRIQVSFNSVVMYNSGAFAINSNGAMLDVLVIRKTNVLFNYFVNITEGQLVTTIGSPPATINSSGFIGGTRPGIDAVPANFDTNSNILLLEAESGTATNDNIVNYLTEIELTRLI